MANEVSIYEPRHLIEVVRTTPPIRTFLRDRFFSNVKTFPTRRVDIDIVKGNRKMAAFIHPLVGGEIVQSEGYETKSYAPPLINPATISTADQYMERLPGEDLFSGRTPADRAAEKLIEEYNQLNDMTTRREEWMAAQVLTTGKLKVKGRAWMKSSTSALATRSLLKARSSGASPPLTPGAICATGSSW